MSKAIGSSILKQRSLPCSSDCTPTTSFSEQGIKPRSSSVIVSCHCEITQRKDPHKVSFKFSENNVNEIGAKLSLNDTIYHTVEHTIDKQNQSVELQAQRQEFTVSSHHCVNNETTTIIPLPVKVYHSQHENHNQETKEKISLSNTRRAYVQNKQTSTSAASVTSRLKDFFRNKRSNKENAAQKFPHNKNRRLPNIIQQEIIPFTKQLPSSSTLCAPYDTSVLQQQQESGASHGFKDSTKKRFAKVTAIIGFSRSPRPINLLQHQKAYEMNQHQEEVEKEKIDIDVGVKKRSIVFLEIASVGRPIGKVYFELFEELCPKTCENFRGLCSGNVGMSTTGTPLHYKGTRFFRVIPNFIIQGGDVTHDNGSGGECIWTREQGGWHNRFFEDESFEISHHCCGLLSMANEGPNTNQSQFFITCAPCPWLDCRNVVFGRVIKGYDVLGAVESMGSFIGSTPQDVRISDCGVCPADAEIQEDPFDFAVNEIEFQQPPQELRPDEWSEIGVISPNSYVQSEQMSQPESRSNRYLIQ